MKKINIILILLIIINISLGLTGYYYKNIIINDKENNKIENDKNEVNNQNSNNDISNNTETENPSNDNEENDSSNEETDDNEENVKDISDYEKMSEKELLSNGFTKENLNKEDDLSKFVKTFEFTEESTERGFMVLINDSNNYYELRIKVKYNNGIVTIDDDIFDKHDKYDNVKSVYVIVSQFGGGPQDIYLLYNDGKVYKIEPFEGGKNKEYSYNFKKIVRLEFKIRSNQISRYVGITEKDEYYSFEDERIIDYVYYEDIINQDTNKLEGTFKIDFKGNFSLNNKQIGKVKKLYGDFIVDENNNLYDIRNIKYVNNKKIKNLYKHDNDFGEDTNEFMFVAEFEDNSRYSFVTYYNENYCNNDSEGCLEMYGDY